MNINTIRAFKAHLNAAADQGYAITLHIATKSEGKVFGYFRAITDDHIELEDAMPNKLGLYNYTVVPFSNIDFMHITDIPEEIDGEEARYLGMSISIDGNVYEIPPFTGESMVKVEKAAKSVLAAQDPDQPEPDTAFPVKMVLQTIDGSNIKVQVNRDAEVSINTTAKPEGFVISNSN